MQGTNSTLRIYVGEDQTPITLTDSAVEAVQEEASANVTVALDEVKTYRDELIGTPADWTGEELLGVRDYLRKAIENVEVLLDCRPQDEFE